MSPVASAGPGHAANETEAVATQRLYERYAGPIFGFCLRRLGTREEAEDAVQTAFLNAQRALRRGVVPEFEAAWLYKIAENVCNTRHDRARRRPESARDLDAMQDVIAAPERSEPDLIAALPDAIARMPPVQRRALLLREWQGLTYREIAAELAVTEAAVETLLYRARRSLMANLERPERRGRLSRVDLGSVVAFLKSLLTGSAAKVVVAAVAVTAAVSAGGSSSAPRHVVRRAVAPHPAGATGASRRVPRTIFSPTVRGRTHAGSARARRGAGRTAPAVSPTRPREQGAPSAPGAPAPAAAVPPAHAQPAPPTPTPARTNVPVSTMTPALPVTTPQLPVTTPSLPVTPASFPAVTVPSLPVQAPPLPPAPSLPGP